VAELFNLYFSSVFLPPRSVVNIGHTTDLPQHEFVMQMLEISLSIHEVASCLDSLDTSKACGSDDDPNSTF